MIAPGQWVQMALSSWVTHPECDVAYLPLSSDKVKTAYSYTSTFPCRHGIGLNN